MKPWKPKTDAEKTHEHIFDLEEMLEVMRREIEILKGDKARLEMILNSLAASDPEIARKREVLANVFR